MRSLPRSNLRRWTSGLSVGGALRLVALALRFAAVAAAAFQFGEHSAQAETTNSFTPDSHNMTPIMVTLEVGDQLRYDVPTLNLGTNSPCTVGAGMLYQKPTGGTFTPASGSSHNGFRLRIVGGVPRLTGEAGNKIGRTTYKLEYICGLPRGWRASYTLEVDVTAKTMKMRFKEAGLGHVMLYKGQDRPIKTLELHYGVEPVTWTISPPLTTGLSLDTSTGVISGAPTAVQAKQTYTITARDSSDPEQTVSYKVEISVSEGMRLAETSLTPGPYVAGQNVKIDRPQLLGGTQYLDFVIDPPLSGGFRHNGLAGIVGSNVKPMLKTTYTVTATENAVRSPAIPMSASYTVSIEVIELHTPVVGRSVSISPMNLPDLSGTIT